jgi:hypothetical protein
MKVWKYGSRTDYRYHQAYILMRRGYYKDMDEG